MDGPSLDAMNLMVSISAEYPYFYTFITILAAFMGFCMASAVLIYLARVHITQTISPEKFNWGLAIPALILAGMLGGFSTTMMLVSGTALDSGAGSLFPPTAITGGLTPDKMLGMFAEQTVRMLGYIFGIWGLGEAYFSRMPEGNRTKIWSGSIRVFVGALLINARQVGNWFGGMGDVFFR